MIKDRTLTAVRTGDPHKGGEFAKIQLQGHWLADAGFLINQKVIVENPADGVLVIRLLPDGTQIPLSPIGELKG